MAGQLPHKLFLILKRYLSIIPFFLAVFITSCEDDPVAPPVNVIQDSNFFDWTYIPINGSNIVDMYVADTNKIYFTGFPVILYYDGQNVTPINYGYPEFYAAPIEGYNENNIFIGGVCRYPCRNSILKKFNGIVMENISIPEDSSEGIIDLIVKSPSDVWMSTENRHIYHYDGSSITTYILPDSSRVIVLLNDPFSNLYAFAQKLLRVEYPTYLVYVFITFKFENNNFTEILRDTVDERSTEMQRIVGISQNTIFRNGKTSLYRFFVKQWARISIPNGEFIVNEAEGLSDNDILCSGENDNYQWYYRVFYYNGIMWYGQSNIQYSLYGSPIDKIVKRFNKYYGFYVGHGDFKNYLFIASYKTVNKTAERRHR